MPKYKGQEVPKKSTKFGTLVTGKQIAEEKLRGRNKLTERKIAENKGTEKAVENWPFGYNPTNRELREAVNAGHSYAEKYYTHSRYANKSIQEKKLDTFQKKVAAKKIQKAYKAHRAKINTKKKTGKAAYITKVT